MPLYILPCDKSIGGGWGRLLLHYSYSSVPYQLKHSKFLKYSTFKEVQPKPD